MPYFNYFLKNTSLNQKKNSKNNSDAVNYATKVIFGLDGVLLTVTKELDKDPCYEVNELSIPLLLFQDQPSIATSRGQENTFVMSFEDALLSRVLKYYGEYQISFGEIVTVFDPLQEWLQKIAEKPEEFDNVFQELQSFAPQLFKITDNKDNAKEVKERFLKRLKQPYLTKTYADFEKLYLEKFSELRLFFSPFRRKALNTIFFEAITFDKFIQKKFEQYFTKAEDKSAQIKTILFNFATQTNIAVQEIRLIFVDDSKEIIKSCQNKKEEFGAEVSAIYWDGTQPYVSQAEVANAIGLAQEVKEILKKLYIGAPLISEAEDYDSLNISQNDDLENVEFDQAKIKKFMAIFLYLYLRMDVEEEVVLFYALEKLRYPDVPLTAELRKILAGYILREELEAVLEFPQNQVTIHGDASCSIDLKVKNNFNQNKYHLLQAVLEQESTFRSPVIEPIVGPASKGSIMEILGIESMIYSKGESQRLMLTFNERENADNVKKILDKISGRCLPSGQVKTKKVSEFFKKLNLLNNPNFSGAHQFLYSLRPDVPDFLKNLFGVITPLDLSKKTPKKLPLIESVVPANSKILASELSVPPQLLSIIPEKKQKIGLNVPVIVFESESIFKDDAKGKVLDEKVLVFLRWCQFKEIPYFINFNWDEIDFLNAVESYLLDVMLKFGENIDVKSLELKESGMQNIIDKLSAVGISLKNTQLVMPYTLLEDSYTEAYLLFEKEFLIRTKELKLEDLLGMIVEKKQIFAEINQAKNKKRTQLSPHSLLKYIDDNVVKAANAPIYILSCNAECSLLGNKENSLNYVFKDKNDNYFGWHCEFAIFIGLAFEAQKKLVFLLNKDANLPQDDMENTLALDYLRQRPIGRNLLSPQKNMSSSASSWFFQRLSPQKKSSTLQNSDGAISVPHLPWIDHIREDYIQEVMFFCLSKKQCNLQLKTIQGNSVVELSLPEIFYSIAKFLNNALLIKEMKDFYKIKSVAIATKTTIDIFFSDNKSAEVFCDVLNRMRKKSYLKSNDINNSEEKEFDFKKVEVVQLR